jgi:hypothetical protein
MPTMAFSKIIRYSASLSIPFLDVRTPCLKDVTVLAHPFSQVQLSPITRSIATKKLKDEKPPFFAASRRICCRNTAARDVSGYFAFDLTVRK